MLPVVFTWTDVDVISTDGEVFRRKAMIPLDRYGNVAARQFVDGDEYPLVVLEPRARASHNHFFAALSDGFDNLPEDLGEIKRRLGIKTIPPGGFINAEHFRKWALCETGWCDVDEFDFGDGALGEKTAKQLAATWRKRADIYCQIMVRGGHVTIKTAKSQSAAAMAKQPFEESKRAVLDLLETMVGVKKGTLMKEAGRSA